MIFTSWAQSLIVCPCCLIFKCGYMKMPNIMSQLMRLWYLSHRRPSKAQASLRIREVSPEPSLFAHMKYKSRRRVVHQTSDMYLHWMAAHARLKNEFMEDEKCANLMTWFLYLAYSSPNKRNTILLIYQILCVSMFLNGTDLTNLCYKLPFANAASLK